MTGLVFPLIVILELPLATITLPVPVQPPAAVTVTEYVPGAFIVMLDVVSPVLQRKSMYVEAFTISMVPF